MKDTTSCQIMIYKQSCILQSSFYWHQTCRRNWNVLESR